MLRHTKLAVLAALLAAPAALAETATEDVQVTFTYQAGPRVAITDPPADIFRFTDGRPGAVEIFTSTRLCMTTNVSRLSVSVDTLNGFRLENAELDDFLPYQVVSSIGRVVESSFSAPGEVWEVDIIPLLQEIREDCRDRGEYLMILSVGVKNSPTEDIRSIRDVINENPLFVDGHRYSFTDVFTLTLSPALI